MAGYPGVYAVGDVANIPSGENGAALPQLGSVAQQSGKWAGQNIVRELHGEPTKPFAYKDKGIMAMIGRNAAVAEVGKHHHQVEGPVAFAPGSAYTPCCSAVCTARSTHSSPGAGTISTATTRPPSRQPQQRRNGSPGPTTARTGRTSCWTGPRRPRAPALKPLEDAGTQDMASRAESRVVNRAGLVQGITMVTFPAASSIFTDPTEYDLTNTQYGAMFLPQVVTAIITSLLGSRLAHRFSSKQVLLIGLAANITAMVLLVITSGIKSDPAAYPLLLIATALLGAGFGLTVPVLNTYVAAFRPDRVDKAVLVLNALLRLGTALAPVFVAVFVVLGFWPLKAETAAAGDSGAEREEIRRDSGCRRVCRAGWVLRNDERQLVAAGHDVWPRRLQRSRPRWP